MWPAVPVDRRRSDGRLLSSVLALLSCRIPDKSGPHIEGLFAIFWELLLPILSLPLNCWFQGVGDDCAVVVNVERVRADQCFGGPEQHSDHAFLKFDLLVVSAQIAGAKRIDAQSLQVIHIGKQHSLVIAK